MRLLSGARRAARALGLTPAASPVILDKHPFSTYPCFKLHCLYFRGKLLILVCVCFLSTYFTEEA